MSIVVDRLELNGVLGLILVDITHYCQSPLVCIGALVLDPRANLEEVQIQVGRTARCVFVLRGMGKKEV
jgi:hypothetical protein